jgi:hypothetical protein
MTDVADKIIRLLTPALGSGLATSAVYMQCKKINIMPEDLSSEKVSEFAHRFKKTLLLFAGEQIASELEKKILELK